MQVLICADCGDNHSCPGTRVETIGLELLRSVVVDSLLSQDPNEDHCIVANTFCYTFCSQSASTTVLFTEREETRDCAHFRERCITVSFHLDSASISEQS